MLGWRSREAALLLLLTLLLVARTILDIWFSTFNGRVVRSIVSRDHKAFISQAIVLFGIMMWPMVRIDAFLLLAQDSCFLLVDRQQLDEGVH